jgi:hypothetical protein
MSLSDAGNIADLNADSAINFRDFAKLGGCWQVERVLICQDLDRDGTVGPNDLAILADNWLGEVKEAGPLPPLPALPLAHWKLDETEGTAAHDSIHDNDGTLVDAVWRPTGGKVDGALEFDGEFDFVTTPFVLNPADGPLSVFAWVKGGAPGQVIISQTRGANWLCTDPSDGKLMSDLRAPGQADGSIISQAVITDGTWHHIGFVWDGEYRYVCVDGAQAAKDAEPLSGLQGADGGLFFAIANTYAADTCWRGFIDDIRIYNQALSVEETEELAR